MKKFMTILTAGMMVLAAAGAAQADVLNISSTTPGSMAIQKCTVAAGKPLDSISFSGTLDATEADFTLAMGDVVKVSIESDLMAGISFQFPITDATFKKGKFKDSEAFKGSTYGFSYDTKKGTMAFSAKNVNLTGLACPVEITISIGSYEAEQNLTETIINGAKPCPSILMMGVWNNLNITKFAFKPGKTTNSDSLSAQGTFSVSGTFQPTEPFILTLGSQTFTVPGNAFKWAKGVATCTNAPAAEGGLVSAKFDTNTGTFTVTVKKTFIESYGNATFELSLFGILLGGIETAELGSKTYFNIDELTRQNVPGASWTYNSSYTVSAMGERESGTLTSSMYVQNNLVDLNGHLCTVITSGAGDEEFSMARYMDSDGIHAAQWGTTSELGGFNAEFSSDFLYAPQYIRIGQSFSDAGTYEGYYDLDNPDVDISDFHGTASTSLKLIGYETITVPYGTYSAVKSQQDLSLSGQMHVLVDTYDIYYNKIAKFTATCKQTVWSVENVGTLKMITTMSTKISLPGQGSLTVTIVQTSDLVSAN